jgi:hypothetical protein
VAEGKTIKRAAIPIMLNNSLLSEIYCQNNGQAPNRNKGTEFVYSQRILERTDIYSI